MDSVQPSLDLQIAQVLVEELRRVGISVSADCISSEPDVLLHGHAESGYAFVQIFVRGDHVEIKPTVEGDNLVYETFGRGCRIYLTDPDSLAQIVRKVRALGAHLDYGL